MTEPSENGKKSVKSMIYSLNSRLDAWLGIEEHNWGIDWDSKSLHLVSIWGMIVASAIVIHDIVSFFIKILLEEDGTKITLLNTLARSKAILVLVAIFGIFAAYDMMINLGKAKRIVISRLLFLLCGILILLSCSSKIEESSNFPPQNHLSVQPFRLMNRSYEFDLNTAFDIDSIKACKGLNVTEIKKYFCQTLIDSLSKLERSTIYSSDTPVYSEDGIRAEYDKSKDYISSIRNCLDTSTLDSESENKLKLCLIAAEIITLNSFFEVQEELRLYPSLRISENDYKEKLVEINSLLQELEFNNTPTRKMNKHKGAKFNFDGIMYSINQESSGQIKPRSITSIISGFYSSLNDSPRKTRTKLQKNSDLKIVISQKVDSLRKEYLKDAKKSKQINKYIKEEQPLSDLLGKVSDVKTTLEAQLDSMKILANYEAKVAKDQFKKFESSYIDFQYEAESLMDSLTKTLYSKEEINLSILDSINSAASKVSDRILSDAELKLKKNELLSEISKQRKYSSLVQSKFDTCKSMFDEAYKFYRKIPYEENDIIAALQLRFLPIVNYIALGLNWDIANVEQELQTIFDNDAQELAKFRSIYGSKEKAMVEKAKLKQELKIRYYVDQIEKTRLYFEHSKHNTLIPESDSSFNFLTDKIDTLRQYVNDKGLSDSVFVKVIGHNGLTANSFSKLINTYTEDIEKEEIALLMLAVRRAQQIENRLINRGLGDFCPSYYSDREAANLTIQDQLYDIGLFRVIESSVSFEVANKELLFDLAGFSRYTIQ